MQVPDHRRRGPNSIAALHFMDCAHRSPWRIRTLSHVMSTHETPATSSHPLLVAFLRSDASPMVAAALHVLSVFAADPVRRNDVVAPWGWSLRQRARQLEAEGLRIAAAQARVIARVVDAVALGEISSEELARQAAAMDVDADARAKAIGTLVHAMTMPAATG